MRILFINDFGGDKGGAEVYDRKVAERLEERGHITRLFFGEEQQRFKQFASGWYSAKDHHRAKELADSFSPDIVFAHSVGNRLSPIVLRPFSSGPDGAPVLMKIPNLSIYDPDVDTEPPFKKHLIVAQARFQRAIASKFVDKFIAPSNQTLRWINSVIQPKQPPTLIRNPSFLPAPKDINYQASGKALFVGRIDGKKGVGDILTAFAKPSLSEYRVDIIGDGEEREQLEQRTQELNITDRVSFRGHIPNERLTSEYRRADVFLLPSPILENSPLTIIEALSQGTPVITTNQGGQAELINHGETGYLIAPNNPSELCRRAATVLSNNDLRCRLSNKALKYAQQYNEESHVEELERILAGELRTAT